jgi:biotin operon repressor
MAIFRVYERPSVGQPPEFIRTDISSVGGLSKIATVMGQSLIETGKHEVGNEESFSARQIKENLGFSIEETNDAIDELKRLGLVETRDYLGTHPYEYGDVIPTYALFLHFREHGVPYDPEQDIKVVASAVAAKKKTSGDGLVEATGLSPLRINRAVAYLKDYGVIELIKYIGTAPFDFGEVWAIGATRRFVAEQCS